MDLITTFQVMNLVAGVSLAWLVGTLSLTLVKMFSASPLAQSILNTTLVVLETTEVVWRPIVNASLIVLKPFGPLALVLADSIVKAMVIFGYITAMVIVEFIQMFRQCIRILQSAGMSVSTAVQNAYEVTKDFAFSLATLAKAFTYLTIRLVNTASYIVTSFEKVGDFLYTLVFEAHKVTWDDVYSISLPFLVVASIVGYVAWRSSSSCRRANVCEKKCEDIAVPRRSSRLARKRAMLLSSDVSPILASCKATPRTPTMAGGGQRTPNL